MGACVMTWFTLSHFICSHVEFDAQLLNAWRDYLLLSTFQNLRVYFAAVAFLISFLR